MGNIWTAISRELYNGKLNAIGFVGVNNERIRVSLDDLPSFFANNSVTNIIYDPYKRSINSSSINIACLDTYKCYSSGRCDFVAGVGEAQIIAMAQKTINSLKKDRDKQKAIEKKQEKREETVRKVAITATIISATAAGVKALGKNIENQNSKDIKRTVYVKLKRYNKLLEQIIQAKYNTNKTISENTSITTYSKELECRSIKNDNLRQDIMKYGIQQYIRNIQVLIRICMEPIIKYNLMDESLRELGAETTLRLYRTSLDLKIGKIGKLHLETMQLLKNRAHTITTNSQNQQDLIKDIEGELKAVERTISKDMPSSSEFAIRNSIQTLSVIDTDVIREKVKSLDDDSIKNEYFDYLYNIDSMIANARYQLGVKLQDYNNKYRLKIDDSVNELTLLMSDIQEDSYNTNEINGIVKYITDEINNMRKTVEEAPIEIRESLKESVEKLVDSFKLTKQQLELNHT